jgi:transposase
MLKVFISSTYRDLKTPNPRQLMAYLGLVPAERSSGPKIRRGAITKTGNRHARRVLVEAAWSYRYTPRVTRIIKDRQKDLPTAVRAIAWKAQLRLTARYRRLSLRGKLQPQVVTAVARELSAFIWAIAKELSAPSSESM